MREEDEILEYIVALLRFYDVTFCHVPNERAGGAQQQARWNRQGRQPGVPDLLIFDRPLTGEIGAALELKTATARKSGQTIERQRIWLSALAERGWAAAMTFGKTAAIDQLIQWGYVPCDRTR